ncbi:MAG TPA: NADP-dependent oxidoreductase [Bacillales bacterium]|nr:NADP-dependent oxidoreductase [Bacillales bacterium]
MKAVVIEQYGGTDELKMTEMDQPALKDNDVLIEIAATSINPVDWKIREGYLQEKIKYEFPLILGLDAAGVVKEIGNKVTSFQVGDEVFTRPDILRNGTYAEYVAVDERLVAGKPDNLSFEEAASIPLVGLTSWQCLIDKVCIKEGERVLIHAGAGGVGNFAIQLAKARGCWVATTCSSRNAEFLKDLGADQVINYEKEDFTDVLSPVDTVFDTLGGEIQEKSYEVLKKKGHLVSIADVPDEQTAEKYGVKVDYVFMDPDGEELAKIGELLKNEKIKPVIGKTMKLSDIQEAHNLSETGHMRGKLVLKI